MVDFLGHLAMGLLWALPAWLLSNPRTRLVFIGLAVAMAPIPDVDRWLEAVFPSLVHHHGVTHTVLFVAIVSTLAGAAATAFSDPLDQLAGRDRLDGIRAFAFVFGALLLGGLSHLFGDMLSAPDLAEPIEPFWPVFDKPWSIDVIWYNSPYWNLGLLLVALALHGLLFTISSGRLKHRPA